MALLEDKIQEIPDTELRRTILEEIRKLKELKQFGLVFEQHIPEVVPIFSSPIKPNAVVAKKTGNLDETFRVKRIIEDNVELIRNTDGSIEIVPTDSVTVVKQFGEPIYPALIPMDKVHNGGQTPHHVLIEADNFHALQLLEYVYTGQIDCIYIDPPYNTGARDWKYNNNFVDRNDTYRHSKWLSFMQKRLELARNLLCEDGVLIIAIDDYEVAHLLVLLEDIFPGYDYNTVVVNHHPQGSGGDNVSRTHEYAIFLTPKGKNILKARNLEESVDEWSLARSGRDIRNFRRGRPNSFYAIHVNPETFEVMGVGPSLGRDEPYPTEDTEEGYKRIYPISRDGSERVWRFERTSMIDKINEGVIKCTPRFSMKLLKNSGQKNSPVFSNWYGARFNAGPNGTDLLTKIFGRPGTFPYPKSIYSVFDALAVSIGNKKNAKVLDFFAGSATTLNALCLLNNLDGGHRQAILVTNNEVSEEEAKILEEQGFYPGHSEWEQHGICRSVTFPRCKYTILGQRDDGTGLEGEYSTGRLIDSEKPRNIKQLGFVDGRSLNLTMRKQLVALIEGIPQSKMRADMPFFIDEECTASILFDDSEVDNYLEALEDQIHITDFYIITSSASTFRNIKASITEILGPILTKEEEKRPLSDGFPANLDYFRLDFLEHHEVAMGLQFEAILPILWMISGGKGQLPQAPAKNVPWLIEDGCPFAVLIKESRFRQFVNAVQEKTNLTHVFLITNSEEAFYDMKAELDVPNVIMLYKNYLRNFELYKQWRD